jgi:Leucine-rich repeat (LRR) protein
MSDLKQLKKIEKIIGKELKPCPANQSIMDWENSRTYLLNNQQKIIGLNVSHCNLEKIDFLKALTNLTRLDLADNNLSDLSALKALKQLTELDLAINNLSNISALKTLKQLTELNLADNNLGNISALKELKQLTELDLRNNQLKTLPEWLLNFNCEIKWHSHYENNCIVVGDNPLEEPPPEIIKQGNKAIRAYFEQLKEGQDRLYEAKLILVGEGGSGKTSLANKIIDFDYQLVLEPDSKSTEGISILSHSFPYKDKTFKVNIWDFGGQEIYHQTHQFFLSKRALYFLVADNRNENTDFYYWLNIVDLLSENSPLLIIKNEKNNRSCSIPDQQLRAEFGNIKEVFATNLSDNRGLAEIVESFQHQISRLPHIGISLPKTWIKVRKKLEEDTRYYMDLQEYFEICEANGFKKEADKLQLSEYLHDLGVCLHFQKHDLLCKTLILKPTWATDAVYKILDNPKVKNNFGRFNKQDLDATWKDEQYTTMRGELLALMLNFKLCFEIPNQAQHYIAPQLLEYNAPDYKWYEGNNLLLRYRYQFMPKGLMSQFIVRMHQHIADNYQLLWKSGVVLKKDHTQAEIIEYYGKREIRIRVHGFYKRDLLHELSLELDKINNSYDRLKDKCKKLIPCCCEQCGDSLEPHFYENPVLKQFRLDGHPIQCPKSYQMVSVLELIDDIDPKNFQNLSALNQEMKNNSQSVQVTINNTNQVKDMSSEKIDTGGGAYVNGDVNTQGGDFVNRDKIITNNQSMSKEEFLQLLQTFKQYLTQNDLPNDDIEAIKGDLKTVEMQLEKDAPKKSSISRRLGIINGILEDASNAMDTTEKGSELFTRLVATGQLLIRGLGFLG